jgi:hypothetical protein
VRDLTIGIAGGCRVYRSLWASAAVGGHDWVMEKLFAFCAALDERRASYEVRVVRAGAVMVSVMLPGQYLEIEFLDDGSVEIERFVSQGVAGVENDDLDGVIAAFER